jgi:hypothetical protein
MIFRRNRKFDERLAQSHGVPLRNTTHDTVRAFMDRSVRTVKADAARFSFSAVGDGMVWAVLDSGIDRTHPHFALHGNLEGLEDDVAHKDFTGGDSPLTDEFGHGTHVAGIIAGEVVDGGLFAYSKHRDEHGVNMSLGYEFDPEWFACGQSPLCVEVDRLVRTGDGRLKPDLVAPGEKILSVRREFIGQPERVKDIFLSTATDLKRERYFQGHGLVDIMRAIQSV